MVSLALRSLGFGTTAAASVFLGLAMVQPAGATSITLDTTDTALCEIQVTIGPEAPKGPIHRFTDVDEDDRYTFETNRLCHRRSIGGEACLDDYTDWTCCDAKDGEDITCRVP